MSRPAEPRPVSAGGGGEGDTVKDGAVSVEPRAEADEVHGDRQSVSELVRSYGDSLSDGHKRDRSESGDPAPPGKRGARDLSAESVQSPSSLTGRNFKDRLDAAIEELEDRIMVSLSRELHEFRETVTAEVEKLNNRVKDLERHVEERDSLIDQLSGELSQSKKDFAALQARVEDAEINSRLPCLVLSGAAMASRHAPRLEPPLPDRAAPAAAGRPGSAGSGQGRAVTSRPADRPAGARGGESVPVSGSGGRGGERERSAARVAVWEEREDINGLVVNTLNRCMAGLKMTVDDIDRAHRLPGPNNKVIVRFVRSGQGSVRDMVMSRRLELRGKDLFINESLTKLRSLIFRSLLAAKRERKIYTVYSRGGQVYYKEKQHGVGARVDSVQRVRELGYAIAER